MTGVVESYESINGQLDHRGRVCRDVHVRARDPFVKVSMTDVVSAMDEGGTFAVLFAFPQCPWCRVVMANLCAIAQEMGVDEVPYVDVKTSRGVYKRIDGEVTCTEVADDGYQVLLERFDHLLGEFIYPADDAYPQVDMGCKRIFAPNLIAVKDGSARAIATGSPLVKDPFGELDDAMVQDMNQRFRELFSSLN